MSESLTKAREVPKGENENLEFHGYRRNKHKTVITYFFYVTSLGLLRLLFHWFPTWNLYATHSKCCLRVAHKVLVIDHYQSLCTSYFVEDIKIVSSTDRNQQLIAYLEDGSRKRNNQLRMVWCKKVCYVWDDYSLNFLKLLGFDKSQKCVDYYNFNGYSEEERSARLITYGQNSIDVPLNTILNLFFLEALTPFYVFQAFSLCIWFSDDYYYYGIALIVMSTVGITTSIIQTRRNQQNLRNTIDSFEMVSVCRGNGDYDQIPSYNLVPGDLIEISKNGCVMQCDAVLIHGNCIVNESMLTGESIPVCKSPIPKTNVSYNIQEDSFHTLFCGTKVLAVVIRTGFLTSKGELVRSILYPIPSDFKFDQDSYKVMAILTIVAVLGSIYTILSKSGRLTDVVYILLRALDLLTIVIPPALPACITVGKLYALHRLQKKGIFCINSKVINVSGTVDCMCFDKTGTLTEDGLDLWGVVPCKNNQLSEPLNEATRLSKTSNLLNGMATCHSLTIMEGQLIGDPLDIKMFESTGWSMQEDSATHTAAMVKSDENELNILHVFPFSSNLQRMSSISMSKNSNSFQVFCKGSPEMISYLSEHHSVPNDLQEQLKRFTAQGYRVIAMGSKTISIEEGQDINKIERTNVECNLLFDGLIIFENRVKPVTGRIIKTLRDAHIKTVMITGDNIETALSVAKECGIIGGGENVVIVDVDESNCEQPHSGVNKDVIIPMNMPNVRYAMSGITWRVIQKHFPLYIDDLVQGGVVFARMSGLQKQQLIQELNKQGYYTGMCGDGANDCGALKTAHVGISLSEEEASVASPFTSKQNDISCVENIIREGRAALTTSMGIFKFMICYSLTQFISVIILYCIDDNLTPLQFLVIDLLLVLNMVSTFGRTKPFNGPLSKNRPSDSLLSLISVSSISLQLVLVIAFQLSAYNLIQAYDWFEPFKFNPDDVLALISYENYAVYITSIFQYIILLVIFSKGKPFRKPIYTNKIFSCDIILMTLICLYILFYPAKWIITILDLKVPPEYSFNFIILTFVVAHFICALVFEDLIVEYFLLRKVYPKLHKLFKKKELNMGVSNNILEHKNGFSNKAYTSFDNIPSNSA
ncbi:hypothetical protein RI129_000499 [Pyrocoelia pectoralis]|uniref:Cation-transporting ATPase n=1 Tax=Pyrocoelia pectoralis TaxID=417401 RepID=A0AAN7VKF0_9COLE